MGSFYDTSLVAFFVITLLLGGGAAWMTGRAVARSWQQFWKVAVYIGLLGLAVRFLHYALAHGTAPATIATAQAPVLLGYYVVDFLVLIIIGALSYRMSWASQMATQYPWLYRRSGPLSWQAREPGEA